MIKVTYLTFLIIFLFIQRKECIDSLRVKYWNPFFKDIGLGKNIASAQVETDIFRCYSFRSESSVNNISWKCDTKVPNVIWIPNKRLSENKYIISMTDSLGEIYSIPYGIKKLLSICTSGSIEVFGEYRESNVIVLKKDFTFIQINDCINIK
ncbi:hypothetical protein FG386_002182 [Cryptosporidium ryanae]|uniref:uncharacterized protein n=1 Tax=Cryptosporidium ryanae TaxID=515981 RepID=UPI00351A2072|nr:hypothetical protein FG386_002182 [Cryptosporidium ryanae]